MSPARWIASRVDDQAVFRIWALAMTGGGALPSIRHCERACTQIL